MTYRCKDCKTEIMGNAVYCVACYRKRLKPCGECMVRGLGGTYRVRHTGRMYEPINCKACNNKRWILRDDNGNPT